MGLFCHKRRDVGEQEEGNSLPQQQCPTQLFISYIGHFERVWLGLGKKSETLPWLLQPGPRGGIDIYRSPRNIARRKGVGTDCCTSPLENTCPCPRGDTAISTLFTCNAPPPPPQLQCSPPIPVVYVILKSRRCPQPCKSILRRMIRFIAGPPKARPFVGNFDRGTMTLYQWKEIATSPSLSRVKS